MRPPPSEGRRVMQITYNPKHDALCVVSAQKKKKKSSIRGEPRPFTDV